MLWYWGSKLLFTNIDNNFPAISYYRKWCAGGRVATKEFAIHKTYVINQFPVTSWRSTQTSAKHFNLKSTKQMYAYCMIQPGRQDALAWQINKLGWWGKISHLPSRAIAFWAERVRRVHVLVPGVRAIVNVNHWFGSSQVFAQKITCTVMIIVLLFEYL